MMTQSSSVPNLGNLFQSAHEEGDLSAKSLQVLNVVDVGQQIQAGIGISAIDVPASEVILVSVLLDDSGSIRFGRNAQLVRDGYNQVIDSLLGSKQKNSIAVQVRLLNGGQLQPWCLLENAVRLDTHNYNPSGSTPLYDQMVVLLGSVLAETQKAKDNGQVVRSITLVVTDSKDEYSRRNTAQDVANLVHDMVMLETHIIAVMGIYDGVTDFWEVFSGWKGSEIEVAKNDGSFKDLEPKGGMGILPRWVLVPGDTDKEIRAAFQTFSSSAVRASQNAGSFSQTAVGGFGAP